MADYEVVDNVAIITCQNPPVNQLSYRLRVGLFNGLHNALKDDSVQAIVIIGGGKSFPAGADVKEFSTGEAMKLNVQQFLKELDVSPKPTIAAIHGTALGGGFELALTCHYRIGTSRCKCGLPEVLLGILPGAGGTQRLPRLVGSMLATEMIVTGMHINAQRAQNIGILDKIVDISQTGQTSQTVVSVSVAEEQSVLRRFAINFAKNVANKPFEDRILSQKQCDKLDEFFYNQIRSQVNKRARGHIAPEYCIRAVKAASESNTFEEGLKLESKYLLELLTSPQARALQYSFFAQRQINKIDGINMDTAVSIKKVGIIGCGTMGGGILMNFVQVGIPVVVLEMKQSYLERGLNVVKKNWMKQVKKGKLSKNKFEGYLKLIKTTLNYQDLSDVDIVIEAVFENMSVKEKVFRKLDQICKPSCILASNTSFLDITKIASFTNRPSQVIGTHFFAPANQMLLLENVRHPGCSESTIATVQQMAKVIKKKGVLVGTCDGFLGNRMASLYITEAYRLVLEGMYPKQIDTILYNFGMPMGPFRVMDLSGLDVTYRSREDKGYVQDHGKSKVGAGYYPYELADVLVSERERIGLKVGKGIYDYRFDSKTRGMVAEESKEVNELIVEMSRRKGVKRRDNIEEREVIERCVYSMINEGFKILEEGIADKPSDIDVVFVFGYGFPVYKGGPMWYGENVVGWKKVRDVLVGYSRMYPSVPYFKPSKLLNELANSKMSLGKYWKKRRLNSKL